MKQDGIQAFAPSSLPELSEILWQRLASLIAAADPECDLAGARLLMQAIVYRQLTGSPWAATPTSAAAAAEAAYGRWQTSGLLEQISEVIRIRLDDD